MVAAKGGKRVGYIRVSSVDQNEARQEEALANLHIDRLFKDKVSGKSLDRPQLKICLDYLRDGDVLVIHSMDRLARNVRDLQDLVAELNSKGIAVEFVKEHLHFTGEDSPMSKLMLSILGGVAEFERSLIRERQKEGIAIAKQRGDYRGRKCALSAEQVAQIRSRVIARESKAALAREYGVSRETLYQALKAEYASAL